MNNIFSFFLLLSLTSVHAESFDRKLFKHWIDEDRDCQNTRAETLIIANTGVLKFKTIKECVVVSGRWNDPYTGKTFFKASELDIDHIVPLKFAYEHGAKEWSALKRQQFANDPDNLIAVSKRENRKKGARSPAQWLPSNIESHQWYKMKWDRVIEKYFGTLTK